MAANRAFEPLYRHISSNNISMTAPVETRYPVSTLEAGEIGAPNERGEALVSFLYHSTDIYPSEIAQNIQFGCFRWGLSRSMGLSRHTPKISTLSQ